MPKQATEEATVQNPLVKYATEVGWTYVSREEAEKLRNGETGLFFYSILKEHLLNFNSFMDSAAADEIAKRMEHARPTIDGNYSILKFLRTEETIYHEKERRQLAVKLIDFENPASNTFQVTDEWQFTNGKYRNRADVVFLINGVPIIITETKSAKKEDGIAEGIDQLRRYHEETPELLTTMQVFDVTHLLDFYYGVTWNISRKNLFHWKYANTFEKQVKEFFNQQRILELIENYILFIKKDDVLTKIILRQHQTRAIEKCVVRALEGDNRRGLIWHTQGSGKTYSMITTAAKLLKIPELKKPTIVMLVDRNELETQLFNNLAGYGFGDVQVAMSRNHLQQLFKSDYRGLLVTMIHKFDKIPANLNSRDNIYVLVDEAHRTTSGDLGNYLFACLPNATFIGFTGTPIDKIAYGKGTFKVFGKDDEKGYLDKYPTVESIEDGTTLPLNYTLAPNEMLVPKEQLEREFLALKEAEGVSDIEELNKILEKAVNLRNFLKSNDRVHKVAEIVARHYQENVEPLGYKAFLVGVDREACVLLKEALDEFLPPDYSIVVYSGVHNDKPALKKHHLSKDAEKKIRKRFIQQYSLPKILIVTEKLLTGFDAPILYAMYLDKPMRDHALLQAIARVNRPYEDDEGRKKRYGFVMDFVGIFENLEKALAFDSDDVSGVIQDLQLLKNMFANIMQDKGKSYVSLMAGEMNDKTIEKIILHFADKEVRDAFFKFFNEAKILYEIISPDAFLRPYIDDYRTLAEINSILRNAFDPPTMYDKELVRKTESLVRENVTSTYIDTSLPIYEINGELIDKVKAKFTSDTVRVINLIKTIGQWVKDKKDDQPYLIEIGMRAERIKEMFDNRQAATQKALAELEILINETLRAETMRKEKNMDIRSFTIYWVLKEEGYIESEVVASEIARQFEEKKDWDANSETLRELKTVIYKILMKTPLKDRMIDIAERLLRLQKEMGRKVET